jgi:hypothetical protein
LLAGVGLRWKRFDLMLEGRADVPDRSDVPLGAVETSFLGGTLAPCVRFGAVSGCALGTLGRLSAEGRGIAVSRSDTTLYSLAGLRLGVALPISERVDLRAQADVLAALTSRILQRRSRRRRRRVRQRVAVVSTRSSAPDSSAGGGGDVAERRLLDTARSALARGDYDAALQSLAEHSKKYPAGSLAVEREAIAIRALAESSRMDQARARAARFRARWPRSLLLPAVEAAVEP